MEYSVSLYTALKICQGISTTIVPNKKTVISLELQLYYIKAIQLRDHDQVGNDFFFRVGELHVVFAMCYAIGKYIDSSGLDKLFTQSGIYGHLAVNKILARGTRIAAAILELAAALFPVPGKFLKQVTEHD